jgi:hypothetical protein
VLWVPNTKGKNSTPIPREDPSQAAVYEHALKSRPDPFICQLSLEDKIGVFRIGVNTASLIHRCMSRLPRVKDNSGKSILSNNVTWRMTKYAKIYFFLFFLVIESFSGL